MDLLNFYNIRIVTNCLNKKKKALTISILSMIERIEN